MQNDQPEHEAITPGGTLLLPVENVPPALAAWLDQHGTAALVVSIERRPDGQLALQATPDLDPATVARIRKTLAQYADVLRRLT